MKTKQKREKLSIHKNYPREKVLLNILFDVEYYLTKALAHSGQKRPCGKDIIDAEGRLNDAIKILEAKVY